MCWLNEGQTATGTMASRATHQTTKKVKQNKQTPVKIKTTPQEIIFIFVWK